MATPAVNITVTLADPTTTAYADGETIRVFRATAGGTLTVTAVNAQIVQPDKPPTSFVTITDVYNGLTFWLDKPGLLWFVLDRPTVDDV